MSLKYGLSLTFSILVLLYPMLDFRNEFHEDHIYPGSLFTKRKLLKRNVPKDEIDECIENYNYIGSIQLLEGNINRQKLDTEFDKWV